MSDPILDRSKIELKLGNYGVASYTNLADQGLIAMAREYKRNLSGRMYPLDKEGMAKKIVSSDYHVSRKVDGEFTLLIKRNDEVFTLNPGGTVRVGLAWIDEAAEILQKANVENAVLAGEFYARKPDKKRARVHDVVSIARNPRNQGELDSLAFAVFDVLEWDGTPESGFPDRWSIIQQKIPGDLIHPVESTSAGSSKEVRQIYEAWVEKESAEGIVVRSDSAGFFKIKPRHTIDAIVMGFTESTGEREGMLHDILVGLKRSDGTLQALTKVGGGFTDEQRRELLSDLQDQIVESEYAEVNSDHVAYQMVKPDRVVEISCLDLVSETTRGGPVNRMVLDYDGSYKVIRRFPLASVISPQFLRFREDKQPDENDSGIQQISRIVNVGSFDVSAKELIFPKSEVVSRTVYTKSSKGETMVRKFLVLKTNKESQSEEFPAYVFHYTDFSPNRKTPLSREVRVSSSFAQIAAIRDQFEKDYIKKGWEQAGVGAAAAAEKVVSKATEPLGEEIPEKTTAKKKVARKKTVAKKTGKAEESGSTPKKKAKKKKTVAKKKGVKKKKSS